jgi:lipopolysaccharide transport system ATP-binding protein
MILDIHDFSELGDRFEDPVLTYSTGMTARLFFSTATAGHYEVYLLDEILSVGDQHFQAKCWRRMRDRVSRGSSGVLVTHDWSAIVKLCTRAHILDKGRFVFSGAPERAARLYLWGDNAKRKFANGVAHFVAKPAEELIAASGDDLVLMAEVMIETSADVAITFVIERLQPGFGWETSLMSRKPASVGNAPGRYLVEVCVSRLPLDPGIYQISLHLVTAESGTLSGGLILLDGFGWLDGNGIALEVTGVPNTGLTLPVKWTLAAE